MNDNTLTLFMPVWGQKFLDLLEEYALPSLMLPGNLPALKLDKIYVECIGVEHENGHTVRVVQDGLQGLPIEVAQHASVRACDPIYGLRQIMRLCIQRQSRMLVAMPDTIFANGSISKIFNYAKGKPVTVSAAHFRVNEELFMERCKFWKLWPDIRTYVHNALACGAVDICDSNKDNCTRVGGVSWTQVGERDKVLLHYLPTAFLCWFTDADVRYWDHQEAWGGWDHEWPSLLYKERRLRVVGSTEIFFAIELETASRSHSMRVQGGTVGDEMFHRRQPHNDACGSFLIHVSE